MTDKREQGPEGGGAREGYDATRAHVGGRGGDYAEGRGGGEGAPSPGSDAEPSVWDETAEPLPYAERSGPLPYAEPRGEPKGRARRGERRALLAIVVLLGSLAAWGILYLSLSGRLSREVGRVRDVITSAARPRDPYAEAVSKAEEDRGEAAGRKAKVDVPAELKHYADRRRFLAVQEASTREAGLEASHDFAALAVALKGGGLVEAPRLGRGFVLYGVGLAAKGELTHYDAARGRGVPLFADEATLKAYREGLEADRARLEGELKDSGERLRALDRKDRQGRAQLSAEAAAKRKEAAAVTERLKALELYYGARKGREALFGEYATLAALARDFGGGAYDLGDPASVKEFQARMLRFVRPATLNVMEELGSAYQAKFERPLPVTSLIRTEEYQRTLREAGNANAGDFKSEPHTTGLAFDVYYRFMTADEQRFVMDELARLEREGRVEALRELRDHYHVFAFPEGRRPSEKTVEDVLKGRRSNAARDDEDSEDAKDSKAGDGKAAGPKANDGKAPDAKAKAGRAAEPKKRAAPSKAAPSKGRPSKGSRRGR